MIEKVESCICIIQKNQGNKKLQRERRHRERRQRSKGQINKIITKRFSCPETKKKKVEIEENVKS